MRAIVLAMLLALAGPAWGVKYIRPSTDCALSGNGTAYACAASAGGAGAWRSFTSSSIQSSPSTGETVKTCGDFTSADADTGTVMLVANFTNDQIAVDGDCTAEGGRSYSTWNGGGTLARGIDSSSGGEANLTVRNIRFSGFTAYHIIGQGVSSDNWLIEDSTFECSLATQCIRGLDPTQSGWVVQDSEFYNCSDDCIFTETPMTLRRLIGREWSTGTVAGDFLQSTGTDCDGFVFEDLDLESSKDIKQAIIVNSCPGAVNVTVAGGRFVKLGQSENTSSGMVPLFFDGPSGTVTVRGAYVAGGRINLFVSGGASLVAEGNIFGPSTLSNVHCGSSTPACTVRHNTINDAGTTGLEMQSAGAGGLAVNNAIVGAVGINRGASGVENHNTIIATTPCYVSGSAGACDASDDTDNTTMGWSGGSTPSDAEGYCITPDSPLIGAATNLNAQVLGQAGEDMVNTLSIGARGPCRMRPVSRTRTTH